MFNEDEALALTLGLLTAQRLGLAATAPAVEGALAKVERVMPDALRARMTAVQETLIINASSFYAPPASSDVLTFSVAAQRQQRVSMCYQAWNAGQTERIIDPYGVVFYDGRWFVVGYCHLRDALRMFRLDRVVNVSVCDEPFERPDQFDCLQFVVQSLAEAPGAWYVEVVLETTMAVAREHVPAAMAMLEEHDDGVLLRCHAQNLHWVACFLVSLGCRMLVRQPMELCAALQQVSNDIAATIERSSAVLQG
jgi:predicted DNA-binding transcriptional regulator YafY